MFEILRIDKFLSQLTKILLLFSCYKIAIYIAKLLILVSKKKNHVLLLAELYAQSRNPKMFINTYENLIQKHKLTNDEKFDAYICLGDAYAAYNNYTKLKKIKKINNLKKKTNLKLINCYINNLIFFIKKNNILNTNINYFNKHLKKKIVGNKKNNLDFFTKFKILINENIAPSYSIWLYLLYLLNKKKNIPQIVLQ